MSQTPQQQTIEITEEDLKKAKELTEKLEKQQIETAQKIKEDKDGIYTIEQACGIIFSKAEVTSMKEEHKENSNTGLNKLWDEFQEAAKKIATWASDFIKQIKQTNGIKLDTKKKLRDVCKEFKELLFETSKKLQLYRFNVETMIDTFNEIMELLIAPEEIFEELQGLNQKERLKKCQEYAKENKDELQDILNTLSKQMKDDTARNNLNELSKKWGKLSQTFLDLRDEIETEIEDFKKKLCEMSWVTCIFGGILAGSACFVSGGVVALIGGALLYYGIAISTSPQLLEKLGSINKKNIKVITDGLKNISIQSDKMQTILFNLYKQWNEVMKVKSKLNSKLKYDKWTKELKLKSLFKTLMETKTGLEDLRSKIKGTENVCDEQLNVFTEKLYKPLTEIF